MLQISRIRVFLCRELLLFSSVGIVLAGQLMFGQSVDMGSRHSEDTPVFLVLTLNQLTESLSFWGRFGSRLGLFFHAE
jgi:hypothetical protein